MKKLFIRKIRAILGILIIVLTFSACSISLITERGDNKMINFCWKYYQATKYGTPMPETLHAYSNEAKDIRNSDFNNLTCTPQNKLEFLKCYIEICDKLGFRTTKDSLVKEYNTIATQIGTRSYTSVSAPANTAPVTSQNNATNVAPRAASVKTSKTINANNTGSKKIIQRKTAPINEPPHRNNIDEMIDAMNEI